MVIRFTESQIAEQLQTYKAGEVLAQYRGAIPADQDRLMIVLTSLLDHEGVQTRSGARWVIGEILGVPIQHHLYSLGEAELVVDAYHREKDPIRKTLMIEVIRSCLHEPLSTPSGKIIHEAAQWVLERIGEYQAANSVPPASASVVPLLFFFPDIFSRAGKLENLANRIKPLMERGDEIIKIPGLPGFEIHLIGNDDDMAINMDTGRPLYAGDMTTAGSQTPIHEFLIARGYYMQHRDQAVQLAQHYMIGHNLWWQLTERLIKTGKVRASDNADTGLPTIREWIRDNLLLARVFQTFCHIEAERQYPIDEPHTSLEGQLQELSQAAIPGQWAQANTPLAAARTFVSFQMEMGFHPALIRHLEDVIQAQVKSGWVLASQAQVLIDQIAQSSMG